MGKRGPMKTPTAKLAARGSWRSKTRHGEPEPTGKPRKPTYLDGEASRVFRRLVKQLDAMGMIGEVDENALARYAILFARWLTCERFIKKHGHVMPIRDANGNVVGFKEFPQVGRASRLADQLLRLEQSFGMSPAARANLATEASAKEMKSTHDKGRFFQLTG